MAITSTGGRVALGDVAISGTLRLMKAKTSDLNGDMRVTGSVGNIALGDITGNIFSGASIANISGGVLKGTLFANDTIGHARLGDVTGTIASGGGVIGNILIGFTDQRPRPQRKCKPGRRRTGRRHRRQPGHLFSPGSIGVLRVTGDITSSFIGAGVNPVDSTFGNSNDKAATATTGNSTASLIRRLTAQTADDHESLRSGDVRTNRSGQEH